MATLRRSGRYFARTASLVLLRDSGTRVPIILTRVIEQQVGRKTLYYPLVLQAFIRSDSDFRVPFETPGYEVNKLRIRRVSQLGHDVAQPLLLLLLSQHLERRWNRIIFELAEQSLSGTSLQNRLGRHTNHIDYQL